MTAEGPGARFALLDQFHGVRMGLDLAKLSPGAATVVESARRLRREQSYGYVHALWWLWLEDGRTAVSVPPGAGAPVRQIAKDTRRTEQLFDAQLAGRLKGPVNDALCCRGLRKVDRVLHDQVFACNAELLRRHQHGDRRRLTDRSIPAAEGEKLRSNPSLLRPELHARSVRRARYQARLACTSDGLSGRCARDARTTADRASIHGRHWAALRGVGRGDSVHRGVPGAPTAVTGVARPTLRSAARLPTHCFPDGIVYGVVAQGEVVSVAFAHRTGLMEDQIADLGVGTVAGCRRRGYAKTVVSAVVEHIARTGGEARYSCSPDNRASIATARSVGFVPYGTGLILSAPAPASGFEQ